MPPVFRFAPSPNGYLHLGHAYSALLNFDLARASGGDLERARELLANPSLSIKEVADGARDAGLKF